MSLDAIRRGAAELCRQLRTFYDELTSQDLANGSDGGADGQPDPVLDADLRDDAVLAFADLVLNTRTRDVRRGRRAIELTRTEFRLLELLLRNPRQVLPRELIFERVWGFDFGPTSNTLSVYVGYLRRKTEAEGESRLIHTIRGIGYMLRE